MNYRTLYVVAVPLVAEHLLNDEDQDVKGLYQVNLLPTGVDDAHAASLAHEAFHGCIALGNPGDFSVFVFDPVTQKEITPSSYEVGSGHDCTKVQNDVPGWMVDALEATEWVKAQEDRSPGL